MARVKAGDSIEFAPLATAADASEAGLTRPLVAAKVVEVEPGAGGAECTVQLSPFEPLQRVQLDKTFYKVVYEPGEVPVLSGRMVGWEIEIVNIETQQPEAAVVKRVDGEMNCALVVFENGRKEWMDLSTTRFKVVCRPALDEASTPSRRTASIERSSTSQVLIESEASVYGGSGRTMQGEVVESCGSALTPIPILPIPMRASRETNSNSRDIHSLSAMDRPAVNMEQFDWYTEGSHVELCDLSGLFEEGAILCSKTQTHVQLFNERRQFFEIPLWSQTFKVVIHGLLSLKTIPLGQSIDVYSPMVGAFRNGIVLKTAELGHLTPISFPPGKTVEWLDLSSQTFKLVFAPRDEQTTIELNADPALRNANIQPSPIRSHHPKRLVHYPHLSLGQRVELLSEQSKQYHKYKVAKVLDIGAHEYIFEAKQISGSTPVKSLPVQNQATVVGALPQLRCRIVLHSSQWREYQDYLVGHRVDVYDKISKSVACGTVIEVTTADSEPSLLVRYKDGRREWVFLKSSKVKLRLQGNNLAESLGDSSSSPIAYHLKTSRLETQPVQSEENVRTVEISPNKEQFDVVRNPADTPCRPKLNRRLSDSPTTNLTIHQPPAFTNSLRTISSNGIGSADGEVNKSVPPHDGPPKSVNRPKFHRRLSDCDESDPLPPPQQNNHDLPQTFEEDIREVHNPPAIKSLDLGQLIRFAPSDTDDGTENCDVQSLDSDHVPGKMNAGRKDSIAEPPSDMDMWTEELDPIEGVIQYVHILTGAKQLPRPQWIKRTDPVSGKEFAVHTPTDSIIELPPRLPLSARSSARLSGSTGRLILPVGPLQAVRSQGVQDQIPTWSAASE